MGKPKKLEEMRDMLERLEENNIDTYVNQCLVNGNGEFDDKKCRDLAEKVLVAGAKADEYRLRADQQREIGEKLISIGNKERGQEYLMRATVLEAKAIQFDDKVGSIDQKLSRKECEEFEILRRIMS